MKGPGRRRRRRRKNDPTKSKVVQESKWRKNRSSNMSFKWPGQCGPWAIFTQLFLFGNFSHTKVTSKRVKLTLNCAFWVKTMQFNGAKLNLNRTLHCGH